MHERDNLKCSLTMWDTTTDEEDAIERHLSYSLWVGDDYHDRRDVSASVLVKTGHAVSIKQVVFDNIGMTEDLFDEVIFALYEEAFETMERPAQIKLCSIDFEPSLGSDWTVTRIIDLIQQDKHSIVEEKR